MPKHQEFDYDQPGRDALAGIYVEVSDSAAPELPAGQEGPITLDQVERLFGLTLTGDDENTAERTGRTPHVR